MNYKNDKKINSPTPDYASEKTTANNSVQSSGEYTAKQITVLTGLDPVRKRPGMYIGGTGVEGLHHLIWEVVDNSIDEAMAEHCKNIVVTLSPENKISVEDDGRGIPVEIHTQTKKSALETVLTTLHAGGKFGEGGGYKVSGGLHGVGVSVVNALSKFMQADVYRDRKNYRQEFSRGKPITKVQEVGVSQKTGTKITFQPDEEIFKKIEFDYQTILDRLRQQAYLTKGVKITVIDERGEKKLYNFYFEGGIASYVRHMAQNKHPLSDPPIYLEKSSGGILIEVALTYVDDFNEHVFAFANNIHTSDGGTHLTGFRTALTRAINDYAKKSGFIKDTEAVLTGDDVREGLTAVLSVKLSEPQFEGQTKAKLGNPEARTAVDIVTAEGLSTYLEEHPADARKILEKCLLSAHARLAAKAARETVIRKGALEGMTLPGKLADCSEKDPSKCELYIVEGDSAGGCFSGDTKVALMDGRNLSFQKLVKEYKKGVKNYCYTIKRDGTVGIGQVINPRCTKKNTKVLKIVLDNKKEIICTPDHKFMLRNGDYKMAKYLTSNDSLMPLYRKYSQRKGRITEGYEMVLNPRIYKDKPEWIFSHLLADRYNLEKRVYRKSAGQHKHHIDFNKLNNNPNNIQRMDKEQHLDYHRKFAKKNLTRKDVLEKLKKLKSSLEFRLKMSKRMKQPQTRKLLSENAQKQWQNASYKLYMMEKFKNFYQGNSEYRKQNNKLLLKVQQEYWSKEENRKKQQDRVKKYYQLYPEKKKELSILAKNQWNNNELKVWRSNETKRQWTNEFREKRKKAYNQFYLNSSLSFAKKIYEKYGHIDFYDNERHILPKRDNNLLKLNTLLNRFFSGNKNNMEETIKNYNHKIKRIEEISKKMDVYDLEVEGTHNFALSSGVFVHNSAKQGRDRTFQAILPLRGKILNVERARLDRMLTSEEIKNLIVAMGCGIGEELNIEKIRYHRIIIMTDADVDGSHIRTLLLTFFYRHFPDIIKNGYLYIAQPPLYAISRGKEKHYAYSDEEKDKIIKGFSNLSAGKAESKNEEKKDEIVKKTSEAIEQLEQGAADRTTRTINIQRYKGLGEMNPTQLWETTMDPAGRVLLQTRVEEPEKADEVFSMLMGDEVAPRKRFIQTHAQSVKNLDV